MSKILDRAVYVEANGINKTLKQAIIDGDLNGGGGGSSPVEVFSHTVTVNGASYSTLTGLNYFTAPQALTISYVRLQLFTKNGVSSGSLTVDVKKNTTPNDTGMASIFLVKPTLNFVTAADYDINGGAVLTSSISSGDVLRLDVTSIPSGWVGSFTITVYA